MDQYVAYVEPLQNHPLYEEFAKAIYQFYLLMTNKDNDMEEWKKRSRAFGIHMSTYFGDHVNACIYLHLLTVHGHRFYPLSKWTSCGLERVNYWLKQFKRTTKHDKLPDSGVLSAAGALVAIVNRFNSTAAADLPIPIPKERASPIKPTVISRPLLPPLPTPPSDAINVSLPVNVVPVVPRRSKRDTHFSQKIKSTFSYAYSWLFWLIPRSHIGKDGVNSDTLDTHRTQ